MYQVLQRDDIKEGSQLDGHWYSASITFRGKTQSVSLDALATEIGDHMGRIHREDTPLTTDIMRVAIKTNDPAFTSMYALTSACCVVTLSDSCEFPCCLTQVLVRSAWVDQLQC